MPIVQGYFAWARQKGLFRDLSDYDSTIELPTELRITSAINAAVDMCRQKIHRFDPTISNAMNYFTKVAQRHLWQEFRKESTYQRHFINETSLQSLEGCEDGEELAILDVISEKRGRTVDLKAQTLESMHYGGIVERLKGLSPDHAAVLGSLMEGDGGSLVNNSPSAKRIAAEIGLPEKHVQAILQELKACLKVDELGEMELSRQFNKSTLPVLTKSKTYRCRGLL